MSDILAPIDGAIRDAMSPDAMRWVPEQHRDSEESYKAACAGSLQRARCGLAMPGQTFTRDCELHGEPEPFAVKLIATDGQRKCSLLVAFEQIEDFGPYEMIEWGYRQLERALQSADGRVEA